MMYSFTDQTEPSARWESALHDRGRFPFPLIVGYPASMKIDISRCEATSSDGMFVQNARFAFANGKAALWTQADKRSEPQRVFYAEDTTLERAGRQFTLSLSDGSSWAIIQRIGGGCSCSKPARALGFSQLLAPPVDA